MNENKTPKQEKIHEKIVTNQIGRLQKTYEVKESNLATGDSLRVNGFLAVKGPSESDFLVVINPEITPSHHDSTVETQLKGDIQNDLDFMRSAYFNFVAIENGMTLPDAVHVTDDQRKRLEELGLMNVLATGSLEQLEKDGRPVGLVLSRGNQLTEKEDIEARAGEVGLYSKTKVTFSNGEETCIAATDAAGNRFLMPYSEELDTMLQEGFGYQNTDGDRDVFNVQQAFNEQAAS